MQYEMCMGRRPFEAQNEGALIRKILRGIYAPVDKHGQPLRDLVARCLTFRAANRPTAKDLLQIQALRTKVSWHLILGPVATLNLEFRIARRAQLLNCVPLNCMLLNAAPFTQMLLHVAPFCLLACCASGRLHDVLQNCSFVVCILLTVVK